MANNKLIASDSFLSGSLAPGWASINAGFGTVVAGSPNTVQPTAHATNFYGQIWTGNVFPADQISEVTVNGLTVEVASSLVLRVRDDGGGSHFYQANFNNGTCSIGSQVGATFTTLASGSATLAAGDVVAFSVVGSCLSLYQNGTRLLFYYDTNLTSGSPGFAEHTTTTPAHVQVSSWRGYSIVQQDGVWTKQGIVIPANTADLPVGCANCSQILYEGNAQLLSGTVYKMWFASWSANAIGYAESTDGIAWTRNGSAVLSSVIDPSVIKVGNTYYLYAFASGGGGNGTGNCNVYTSSDGISWTLAASNIAPGTTYFFSVFTVKGGTWYALGGGKLYTSSDGLSWSTSGVRVMPANFGPMCGGWGQANDGTWYVWGQTFNPGSTGNAEGTEIARAKCTDPSGFTTWVLDTHSAHISQMFESLNTFDGQCVPGGIINVGSKTYFYCSESPGDALTPSIYQIGLLTAPTSIQGLVQFPENAASQLASDAFTNGNGPLSGSWTTITGWNGPTIVTGPFVQAPSTAAASGAYYNAATFGANQYSEITIHTLTTSNLALPMCRIDAAYTKGYDVLIQGATGSTATVKARANQTQFGPTVTINLTAGDKIRLQVIDNVDGFPVISIFQNGWCIFQAQDYTKNSLSGFVGFWFFDNIATNGAQVSNWAGGNAAVIPNYPVAGGSTPSPGTIAFGGTADLAILGFKGDF